MQEAQQNLYQMKYVFILFNMHLHKIMRLYELYFTLNQRSFNNQSSSTINILWKHIENKTQSNLYSFENVTASGNVQGELNLVLA